MTAKKLPINPVEKRLFETGPKRILSLDGGGIRGILTLGFLQRIEDILRARHANPDLVLSDYFDFIGGTSTGSIIASALAIGKSIEEIKNLYMDLGKEIFKPRLWINKYIGMLGTLLGAQYSTENLDYYLRREFKDITLGDDRIKTGLCIVTKRADTRSTWPFFNNPRSKYFKYNKDLPLKSIIRASTAAPTKFQPELVDIGNGNLGAFIDGGVGSANNPALHLFLLATLKCYRFNWKTGADNLLLVSVGTGYSDYETQPHTIVKKKLSGWLDPIMDFILQDINELNQIVLQSMARTPQPTFIDSEMEDLKEENLAGRHLLHYMRYNVKLEDKQFERLNLTDLIEEIDHLHSIEDASNSPKLARISAAFANDQVKEKHFPKSFDIAKA